MSLGLGEEEFDLVKEGNAMNILHLERERDLRHLEESQAGIDIRVGTHFFVLLSS